MIRNRCWASCELPFSLVHLVTLGFFRQICEKYSNIKLHVHLSNSSRVVPYGRTHRWTDGQTERRADMTQVIVAFLNWMDGWTDRQTKRRADMTKVIVAFLNWMDGWTDGRTDKKTDRHDESNSSFS
jgi:hypothetical protein